MGLFRSLTCGGWTYVTSTDDHQWHDIFMISYLVATLPWTLGCLALSPNNFRAIKYRKYLASAFFGTLVPLIYYFIQHKVHRVPGGKNTRYLHISCNWLCPSIHNICFLWMGLDFVWCSVWCSHSSWFWHFRVGRERCQRFEQGVRWPASKIQCIICVSTIIHDYELV